MSTVILVIHVLLALALVVVVLLKRSEGGGLGMGGGGGMSGFLTGRATANVLTRATAILAGLFMLTSIVLAVLAGHNSRARSIVDRPASAPASTDQAPAEPAAPAAPSR